MKFKSKIAIVLSISLLTSLVRDRTNLGVAKDIFLWEGICLTNIVSLYKEKKKGKKNYAKHDMRNADTFKLSIITVQ